MREEQVMQIQGLGPKLPLFCCRASHIRGPPHGVAEEKEKPTGWRRGGGGEEEREGKREGRGEQRQIRQGGTQLSRGKRQTTLKHIITFSIKPFMEASCTHH